MNDHSFLSQLVEQHQQRGEALPLETMPLLQSVSSMIDELTERLRHQQLRADAAENQVLVLQEQLARQANGLEYANTQLGMVLNQVEEGFFSRDLVKNEYIHMSIGCEKIYGYPVGDFYANTTLWQQVIHPADLHLVIAESNLLADGKQVKSCYRIYRKDQSIRWIEVKAIPVFCNGVLQRVDGIVLDVTEQKQAKQLLLESEQKYRSFFEHNMDGILLADKNGNVLTANPAACTLFAATESELCELQLHDLVTNPEAIFGDQTEKSTLCFRRRNDTQFIGEVTSVMFKDAVQQQLINVMIRDITDQKAAAHALMVNERKLNLIYNNVVDSIFLIGIENDHQFKFISINQSFLRATGLAETEVIGKYIHQVIPSPALEMVSNNYRLCCNEQRTVTWEETSEYPAGIKTGVVTLNPILDENGKCIRIIGSVHDVTEERQIAAEIKKSEQNFQSLVNTIDGIVWEADSNFEFSFVSAKVEELLGYTSSTWLNTPHFWEDHIHPDDRLEAVNYCVSESLKKKSHSLEYRMLDASGQVVWLHDIVTIVVNEDQGFYLRGIMLDITARKLAEKAARESEEQYATVIEQASDAIFINTPAGIFLEANQSACIMLGYTREEFSGMKLSNVMLQQEVNNKPIMHAELLRGEKTRIERQLVHRDGSLVPVEITAKMLSDGRVIAIARNITERLLAEKNIRELVERFEKLSSASHDAIWDWNLQNNHVWWNDSFYKLLGFDPAPTAPDLHEWTDKIHPDDRQKVVNRLRQVRKSTVNSWEDELRYQSTPGVYGTVLDRAYVLRNDAGRPIRVVGALTDITELKKNQQQIAESEQRHRLIVETAQEGIWLIDENYSVVFVNKKMCELLEYAAEDIIGKAPTFFMEQKFHPAAILAMEKRKKGFAGNMDLPFLTKTGKTIWTNISSSPMIDHENHFVGALAMVTDITKRKLDEKRILQSEADLDLKNKELQRKNAELEQFAYVASHDLQEPLRTTASFVRLLKEQYEGKFDARADKYLNFILDSSERMKILISDLLDYSRIGSKNEKVLINCNQVLKDVFADLFAAIQDSRATITTAPMPFIVGYPTEIKLLFQNLLVNAMKFARQDITPEISIGVISEETCWHFTVADNGIGIDPAHTERIFIIFQRLHPRSQYDGTGIGLSHCKKIVALHNGKLWVTSTLGSGSIFHFTIPKAGASPGENIR